MGYFAGRRYVALCEKLWAAIFNTRCGKTFHRREIRTGSACTDRVDTRSTVKFCGYCAKVRVLIALLGSFDEVNTARP